MTKQFNFRNYNFFDFKNDFKLIKPHLTNKNVVKSIKRAIIGYLHDKTNELDNILYDIKSLDKKAILTN